MSLAPGVHDLALTFDRGDRELTIHPAAVETPRGIMLIDVGLDLETLRGGLAASGLELSDVTRVFLTHQDGDHVAALESVLDAQPATVYAHRRATPYITGEKAAIKGDRGYEPVSVDVEVVGDVRFRTAAGPMTVVETPGHSPGHVSLYFPQHALLLAADALTAGPDGLAGPNPEFTPEMDEARRSVRRLAECAIENVLCYHGGPVSASAAELATISEN
ncbi:MAG: MBL fold metallo-hydrolase [Halobacteriaceae archaeon]